MRGGRREGGREREKEQKEGRKKYDYFRDLPYKPVVAHSNQVLDSILASGGTPGIKSFFF